VRPCTPDLELVGGGEGCGGCEGRKPKIEDTGLRSRSVLNEDVRLRWDIASKRLTLTRHDAADKDNVNSPLSNPHGQFHTREDIANLS